MPKSYSNLTFTESAHIGLDDDTPEVPLKVKRDDNVSLDASSMAVKIDYNLSGSTAQTGDRFYEGLLIDADSSATGGDTTNEVRFSGIRSMVEDSGDANDLYGGYFDARNDKTVANDTVASVFGIYSLAYGRHTAGEVKNIVGVQTYAYTDNADSGTDVTSLAGIKAFALQSGDSGKTVNNAYGGFFKVDLVASSNNGTFTNADGVYGEIEIDDADSTITSARAIKGIIDSNAGTITSAYQFFGTTSTSHSSTITNSWGIYSTGASKHYLSGNLGINTTSAGGNLHVVGESGSSGQIYLTDVDNGTGTGDSLLINKSGTNAFVYNRDGGQMSFGTNDASNNIVIANTGAVTFSSSIQPGGNILLTGSNHITHAATGGIFDLNKNSTRVQLTTNHPEIVFQIDNDHTTSDSELFQINISTASDPPLKLTGTGLEINPISNATSDTDKFLVSDSNVIKYRTGAEVRSDIGAGTGDGTVTVTSGAADQVAFFTSGTDITSTNKFYFDSTNNRLSVNGGTSPTNTLQIGGNGIKVTAGGIDLTGNLDLEGGAGNILMGSGSEFQCDGDSGSSGKYLESTGSGVQWSVPTSSTSQTILNSNFDDATNTTNYQNIPFNYIFESATQSYYHVFACPAAGTVKRITFMHVHGSMTIGQGSSTTQLRVVKNGSTADTSGELSADGGSADGSKIVYEPGTSFANGDRLQFQFSRSSSALYWRGVAVSIVLEFTHV